MARHDELSTSFHLLPRQQLTLVRTLQDGLPQLEKELHQTLDALFHETNPNRKSELLDERSRLRAKEQIMREVLPKFESLSREIQEHHDLFCAGRHPHERAILVLARSRQVSRQTLETAVQKFTELLLDREALERAETFLRTLDADCLKPYLRFRAGKHPQQTALEELAKLERVECTGMSIDEAVEAFARLLRDRRLPIIARSMAGQSKAAKYARERAALQRELAEERARQAAQRDELASLRGEGAQREERLRALEQQLAVLEARERERRDERERRRREILQEVRGVREQEAARAGSGERFRYDLIYGFLMAEGWRLLRKDLAAGVWHHGKENDHYFFLTVENLLKQENFEELYFHEEGRRAIAAVNSFAEEALSYEQLLQEAAACSVSEDVIEAWLVPVRRQQRREAPPSGPRRLHER